MPAERACCVPNRRLLTLSPVNAAVELFHGVTTANIVGLPECACGYTAFLEHRGRYVCDCFVFRLNDLLYVDYHEHHADRLTQLIHKYNWARKLSIDDVGRCAVVNTPEEVHSSAALGSVRDLRNAHIGWRTYYVDGGRPIDDGLAYRLLCVSHLVPDGALDLVSGRSLITDFEFQRLGGLDLQKGCFVGGEMVARTIYRLKKHSSLFVVKILDEQGALHKGCGVQCAPNGDVGYVCGHIMNDLWLCTIENNALVPELSIGGEHEPSTRPCLLAKNSDRRVIIDIARMGERWTPAI